MTQTPWTQQHVDHVARARLTRQRGGYVIADVDRQLHRVLALMRTGRSVPQIAPTALRRTRVREGYAAAEVDALFDRIMTWQRELDVSAPAQVELRKTEQPVRSTTRLRWTRQQQEWVRESRFSTKGGSRSYAMGEVDDFLDEVLVAMAKGEPLPEIDTVKFYPPRRGRSGYDAVAVDEFLDQLMTLRPALPE